ncbi:MAG: hypothetical protein GWO08_15400, partial [Gammaproteobacteria bacterium]|nr:hypothetical protein [Gammaproteobacteria bacterium]NIW49981.1 hypothetical protein [Gammaproteobacteria bacterium]NIW99393.1 hypothetical protein [Phycisphaerae bacterium]
IDIEVQTDYDARGEYGVAKVPVGYTGVRYIVSVESDAPAEVIRHLIDVADAHSSLLEVFAQPQEIRREVKINQAQVEEAKP